MGIPVLEAAMHTWMVFERGFPVCGFHLICGGFSFYAKDLIGIYSRRVSICDILKGRHLDGVTFVRCYARMKVSQLRTRRRDKLKWWGRYWRAVLNPPAGWQLADLIPSLPSSEPAKTTYRPLDLEDLYFFSSFFL
jgi:hypothetical protein